MGSYDIVVGSHDLVDLHDTVVDSHNFVGGSCDLVGSCDIAVVGYAAGDAAVGSHDLVDPRIADGSRTAGGSHDLAVDLHNLVVGSHDIVVDLYDSGCLCDSVYFVEYYIVAGSYHTAVGSCDVGAGPCDAVVVCSCHSVDTSHDHPVEYQMQRDSPNVMVQQQQMREGRYDQRCIGVMMEQETPSDDGEH